MFAIVAGLAIAVTLVASALGGHTPKPASPHAETTSTASAQALPAPEREATPAFATYRSLTLRLPVDPADITAIAFHQASNKKALAMDSLAPDADMVAAAKYKAVAASHSASSTITTSSTVQTVWQGQVLRLWRSNRSGKPDTAADVGADPGTDVYAPVTGTVLEVRPYELYNKYPDFEIHIKPDGWDDIEIVLLHVDDISVAAGDRVTGGVSRIACVRKMSDKIDIQLGGYTTNGGDHVHVQVNELDATVQADQTGGS